MISDHCFYILVPPIIAHDAKETMFCDIGHCPVVKNRF